MNSNISLKIKTLLNHQGFKKYFANTSWLLAEKVLRIGVGLFVSIWVARYLGPDRYGLLSYALSFVGLFTAIATLGLNSIVVRELVKDESKKDILLGTAFWLKLIGAFAVLVILAIAVNFTSNDSYTNSLVFIIASATIFQSFNVIDFYFQSKVLSKYAVYANIISLSLSSILKITLIIIEAPLIAFAWVILFDSMVLACGLVYFYFKNNHRVISTRYDSKIAKQLLRDSWPLILSGIAVSIYMKIDQVMIKEMLNSEAVGQYAAAVKLSEAWYFIPVIISNSIFPSILNSRKLSLELYYSRLQKFYTFMVWLAILVAIPVTFLSGEIIYMLFGNAYHLASKVLMIHVWAGIFVSFGSARSKFVITENMQFYGGFLCTVSGAISNVILNVILIREYGIYGAAIATLISHSISAVLFPLLHPKDRISSIMFGKSLLLFKNSNFLSLSRQKKC